MVDAPRSSLGDLRAHTRCTGASTNALASVGLSRVDCAAQPPLIGRRPQVSVFCPRLLEAHPECWCPRRGPGVAVGAEQDAALLAPVAWKGVPAYWFSS